MAEHSCLQVIIHRLVDKKQIGKSHINALLLILSTFLLLLLLQQCMICVCVCVDEKTAPGGARVRGAVDVLQMCALSNASLISKNVPLLLRLGFGQQEGAQTEAEPLLIRSVCVALQRLRNADLIAYEDGEKGSSTSLASLPAYPMCVCSGKCEASCGGIGGRGWRNPRQAVAFVERQAGFRSQLVR